jgi:multiple sugar transport system substrate-binding protein
MQELELSVLYHGPETADDLRPVLDQFESQHRVHVRLRILDWETAWAELVKIALYSHGPDVSQLGTTWVSNLTAMNALRPFSQPEVTSLGGPAVFLPSTWQTGAIGGDKQVWAVPWLADTRVLYYRRDWLAKAGVDEMKAFQTPQQMAETLQRLRDLGVEVPWVAPTRHTLITLHNLASWVWGAGGDFVSPDGRHTLFNAPEARAGIHGYFDLHRFMPPSVHGLGPGDCDLVFREGRAAVTLSGPWTWLTGMIRQRAATPEVVENFGLAFPPGVPFVGGSSLIVWRHTPMAAAAVELVRSLTSARVQSTYPPHMGQLPVRLDALATLASGENPFYRILLEGFKTSRSFRATSSWGLVEDKLSLTLTELWADLIAHPDQDLDAAIAKHLDPLAKRLDLALESRR